MTTTGDQLRQARESKGFSQAEVSRALCLSVEMIDALERDVKDKLPSAVFVRGYLKNYANFLQLNLFQESHHKPEIIIKHQSRSFQLFGLAGQIFLKLLNYSVIIALIILVYLWWHERQHIIDKDLSITNLSIKETPFPRSLGPAEMDGYKTGDIP